jgi:HEAT repeat protein
MNALRRWLARAFDIRPGESVLVARVALLFALAEAARASGEIGIDTLVSLRLGPQHYPALFVVLGVVSLVVSLGYGAALGRLSRGPLYVGLLLGMAGLLVAGWIALTLADESTLLPALWVATFSASALIVTLIWTVAGAAFDTRQARRLFPVVTGAAIAGSFVGNLTAGPITHLLGTTTLILVEATLLVAASLTLARIPRRPPAMLQSRAHRPSVVAELRAGLDFVAGSPLMRLVAISYVLFSILLFSVTFPFYTAMSRAFPDEADFATATGLILTGVTATSFLMSLTLAARLYARFGVSAGGLLLPIAYLVGFGLWIVSFGVATAILVRWTQQSTQRGLSNAAWSAVYNVVPAQRRAQVLAFNDGVPGQIGIVLSGLLLIAAQRFLGLEQVFWLGAVTAAVCTAIVVSIRRRYAASLIAALRSGLAEQVLEGGPGLGSVVRGSEVTRALTATLSDPEPAVRRMAATMLGRVAAQEARAGLVGALGDGDAGVRAAAVAALVATGPHPETWPVVAARLDDPSPPVRGAVAAGLAAHGDARGAPVIEALLSGLTAEEWIAGLEAAAAAPGAVQLGRIRMMARHPGLEVRGPAVRALAAAPWDDGDHQADLLAALDDPAPSVSRAAAQGLTTLPMVRPALLQVLRNGSDRAQEAALAAIGDAHGGARSEIVAWAHRQVDRAAVLRRAQNALRQEHLDERREFLDATLGRRIGRLEDRAVLAVATLGSPDAAGVLRRSLRAPDQDVRAQAVETLDTLVDRRLGRALAALLEAPPAVAAGSAGATLHGLAKDKDPWIRRLAVASGGSDSRGFDRIGTDGGTMAETNASLAELQRMLALRRVPLFRDLDPEDLQRLAGLAEECWYPHGAALMTEGELGDELVVVIEGSVRVVQRAEGGSERLVRRYGPGEHIGELAVLRERPRSATVVAEEAGVRGLVLGGAGLKAILRERPDAAMAMLATLAERIGTQS